MIYGRFWSCGINTTKDQLKYPSSLYHDQRLCWWSHCDNTVCSIFLFFNEFNHRVEKPNMESRRKKVNCSVPIFMLLCWARGSRPIQEELCELWLAATGGESNGIDALNGRKYNELAVIWSSDTIRQFESKQTFIESLPFFFLHQPLWTLLPADAHRHTLHLRSRAGCWRMQAGYTGWFHTTFGQTSQHDLAV